MNYIRWDIEMGKESLRIKIPKEKLRVKPRHKLQASKPHKDKTKYDRKVKSNGCDCEHPNCWNCGGK